MDSNGPSRRDILKKGQLVKGRRGFMKAGIVASAGIPALSKEVFATENGGKSIISLRGEDEPFEPSEIDALQTGMIKEFKEETGTDTKIYRGGANYPTGSEPVAVVFHIDESGRSSTWLGTTSQGDVDSVHETARDKRLEFERR